MQLTRSGAGFSFIEGPYPPRQSQEESCQVKDFVCMLSAFCFSFYFFLVFGPLILFSLDDYIIIGPNPHIDLSYFGQYYEWMLRRTGGLSCSFGRRLVSFISSCCTDHTGLWASASSNRLRKRHGKTGGWGYRRRALTGVMRVDKL